MAGGGALFELCVGLLLFSGKRDYGFGALPHFLDLGSRLWR